jgi:hypothetical protein
MKKTISKIWKFIPDTIRNNLDIARRCHIWKKNKIIFIHIPKNAGVSINNAIYGKPLGHFYAKDIKKFCPEIFNNLFKFSVVRNPFDRLYSAFCFSREGGTKIMGMYSKNYYINNLHFRDFDNFVNNWLTKQDLTKLDGVFRPQYLYLFDEKYNLLVDDFYKLEKLNNYYDLISGLIGKPFKLELFNQSVREKVVISNKTKKTIYKLYQKDFELFNYSF